MTGVIVKAPAKVNLALHVTARRPDGYHEIETLAVFAETGDRVTANLAVEDAFRVTGPFGKSLAEEPGNLVLRARDALREAAQAVGLSAPAVALHLGKNLPVASGIGGGSADAAAALIALSHVWALPAATDLSRIALALGADVPMCLSSRPLFAAGVGEHIRPLQLPVQLHAVLVNPGVAVATREVFAALKNRDNPAMTPIPPQGISVEWLAGQRNDLQEPAARSFPVIGETLAEIAACERVRLARMSGSGATCFGLFDDGESAQAAAAAISRRHAGWWCVATRLLAGDYPDRIMHEGDRP
ncbi:MAG TPA: 4-(cytidine 5'-diphospho)-2-C-methyl-D-erythritol kinase [Rhizobiaceae bacterium]|nr:4-(cytidine 5'-diphospho)-2-C-methyl-D-erythritol kinase [Rhizobiaceae bacterium]